MKVGLLAALVVFASLPTHAKDGPEHHRWGIKTSYKLDNPERNVPLGVLLALPLPNHGPKATIERQRISASVTIDNITLREGDNVTTIGYLRVAASEPDGDFHLQLSETRDGMDNFLVIEAPSPASVNKGLSPNVRAVRAYVVNAIGRMPSSAGTVLKDPPLVEATGALFYDASHEAKDKHCLPRGKRGMLSRTCWEQHPVARLRTYVPDKLVKERIANGKGI